MNPLMLHCDDMMITNGRILYDVTTKVYGGGDGASKNDPKVSYILYIPLLICVPIRFSSKYG
jgi:hypothetical protein